MEALSNELPTIYLGRDNGLYCYTCKEFHNFVQDCEFRGCRVVYLFWNGNKYSRI